MATDPNDDQRKFKNEKLRCQGGQVKRAYCRTICLVVGFDYKGYNAQLERPLCELTSIKDGLRFAGLAKASGAIVLEYYDDPSLPNSRGFPRRDVIVQELKQIGNTLGSNDSFVFFFGGHGMQALEPSADSLEADARDEELCFVEPNGHYTPLKDDEIARIFLENFKPQTRILCVTDCCQSGTICDLSRAEFNGRPICHLAASPDTEDEVELEVDYTYGDGGAFTSSLLETIEDFVKRGRDAVSIAEVHNAAMDLYNSWAIGEGYDRMVFQFERPALFDPNSFVWPLMPPPGWSVSTLMDSRQGPGGAEKHKQDVRMGVRLVEAEKTGAPEFKVAQTPPFPPREAVMPQPTDWVCAPVCTATPAAPQRKLVRPPTPVVTSPKGPQKTGYEVQKNFFVPPASPSRSTVVATVLRMTSTLAVTAPHLASPAHRSREFMPSAPSGRSTPTAPPPVALEPRATSNVAATAPNLASSMQRFAPSPMPPLMNSSRRAVAPTSAGVGACARASSSGPALVQQASPPPTPGPAARAMRIALAQPGIRAATDSAQAGVASQSAFARTASSQAMPRAPTPIRMARAQTPTPMARAQSPTRRQQSPSRRQLNSSRRKLSPTRGQQSPALGKQGPMRSQQSQVLGQQNAAPVSRCQTPIATRPVVLQAAASTACATKMVAGTTVITAPVMTSALTTRAMASPFTAGYKGGQCALRLVPAAPYKPVLAATWPRGFAGASTPGAPPTPATPAFSHALLGSPCCVRVG
mmetsp:Transcript_101877/g.287439  ORF Transcript_101877/g.287439 Transcript_101877/m.287439 type:complete len:753 (-) Transcript_101877:214-2472(-)